MKCDRCDREATVHEVTIKGGKRHERHLCETCAKSDGIAVQSHTPITQLLTQYITAQAAGAPAVAPAAAGVCPACGLTHGQFRQSGLLGCPECYAAFEGQLGPLLARAHDGGTHHVGKKPGRLREPARLGAAGPSAPSVVPGAGQAEREKKIAAMRKQLAEAVAAEEYERAAQLRDELSRLESAPRLAVKKQPGGAAEGSGGPGGMGGAGGAGLQEGSA